MHVRRIRAFRSGRQLRRGSARACLLFLSLLNLTTGVAEAQRPTGPYFSIGWTLARRDAGSDVKTAFPPLNIGLINGITGAVGRRLTPVIAVELAAEGEKSQSFDWDFNYTTRSQQRLTHSDLPIVGYVRITPECRHRVCLEALAGAGVTMHRVSETMIADCGRLGSPRTCVPVTGGTSHRSDRMEWLYALGGDVPVQISSRIDIVPGARLYGIIREEFLSSSVYRGPLSNNGGIISFSVSLRWQP